MDNDILRSYLFVPATRIDRVGKALATGAHAVIVDLEDAVPPSEKSAARDAAARNLPGVGPVFMRVNGCDTDWFEDDLRLCAAIGVRGVILAKAETADHVRRAAERLPPATAVLPLIESARGFANLGELCVSRQVQRFVFGSIDFQLDLGITGEGEELLYFRSALVLASRIAQIQAPVDGVTVEIGNPQTIRDDTMRARRLGFGAKLCIHPKQVAPVNACFRPSAEDIAWATAIVDAAQAANGAAVAVDGKMVDRPVILKAEEILREAGRSPQI